MSLANGPPAASGGQISGFKNKTKLNNYSFLSTKIKKLSQSEEHQV